MGKDTTSVMNLHAFIEYIHYRWKAKTRHGIHSPFVYAFIDDSLAKKSTKTLEERINTYFGDVVLWLNNIDDAKTNVAVTAIRNIHTSKESTAKWNVLKDNPSFVVSIDLFSIGLLIQNPDIKEKQHYVLQYPL